MASLRTHCIAVSVAIVIWLILLGVFLALLLGGYGSEHSPVTQNISEHNATGMTTDLTTGTKMATEATESSSSGNTATESTTEYDDYNADYADDYELDNTTQMANVWRIPHQFGLELYGAEYTGYNIPFDVFEWQHDSVDDMILDNYCKVKLAISAYYFADPHPRAHYYRKTKIHVLDAYCELGRQIEENKGEPRRLQAAQTILVKILGQLATFEDTDGVRTALAEFCRVAASSLRIKKIKFEDIPYVFHKERRFQSAEDFARIPLSKNLEELWQAIGAHQRLNVPMENLLDSIAYLENYKKIRADRLVSQCVASMYE